MSDNTFQENTQKALDIVKGLSGLSKKDRDASFSNMEAELFKLPQIKESDYSLKEYYSAGMYCREITIPEGALITGRIYKFDHLEVMISGDITIYSADGNVNHYSGHNIIEAKAGKRQAGLAHSDTIWMTVNQVPENIKLDEMLDFTTVMTREDFDKFHIAVNLFDYQNLLSEIELTEDQIQEIVNTDDLTDMPEGYGHVYTALSVIEGTGLFTSKNIRKGDVICPVRVLEKRTIAGRYSNHALHANALPYSENGILYIIANSDIKKGDEITTNYREVLSFRDDKGDLL